eukprot:3565413-Rhodomonas_salina.3
MPGSREPSRARTRRLETYPQVTSACCLSTVLDTMSTDLDGIHGTDLDLPRRARAWLRVVTVGVMLCTGLGAADGLHCGYLVIALALCVSVRVRPYRVLIEALEHVSAYAASGTDIHIPLTDADRTSMLSSLLLLCPYAVPVRY